MSIHRPGLTGALLASLLVIFITGCTQVSNAVDNGPVRTETREVSNFTQVRAGGGAQVTITIGSAYRVAITAEDRVLKLLDTRVDGDRLVIEAHGSFSTQKGVQVEIEMPRLTGLDLSGGAHGDAATLASGSLDLTMSGGAIATLRGATDSATLELSGGAQAHLKDLAAKTVDVQASGGAQAEVTASGRVEGSASGGATVDVWGGASLAVQTSGGAQANSH